MGEGVVVMPPAYVNVGAWIGAGSMVDSHALVGSCAQIGANVHLSAAAQVGGVLEPILFYAIAAVTVISALGVCIAKNIVRMAVWLFIALGSVAMLYFLMAANFIGAVQLIVYVGGTLILLIFGVMLTSRSPWVRFERPKVELAGAAIVCGALLITLCITLCRAVWPEAEGAVPDRGENRVRQRPSPTNRMRKSCRSILIWSATKRNASSGS